MNVTISPDFRDLLPAHSEQELQQLEANCRDDPNHERMPPVLVWGNQENTVIDGHTQMAIRERLGLKIRYLVLEFESRDKALQYALGVQFGRRNLDPSQRAIFFARSPRYAHGGDRKAADQGANLPLDALAKAASVSPRTMKSAAKVADRGTAVVLEGVRNGEFAVSDAAAIVDLPDREQGEIVAAARRDGVTLQAAKVGGGTSLDLVDFEGAPLRERPRNGSSVIPGREKVIALRLLSSLCRVMRELGLFDKHNLQLSEMMRDVEALQ